MVCLTTELYLTATLLFVFTFESAAVGSESNIFERIYCSMSEMLSGRECCRSARVDFRVKEFKDATNAMLFGQPMAVDLLARVVSQHWDRNRIPHKALVLTLHGPIGVGKTYITKILANYIYALGQKSQFYHFFSGMVHFPDKEQHVTYSQQLHSWVHGNVSYCEKSLFVFDEVDRMPVQLLDSLKPFLDYNSIIDGVDFSRSIFIILSNIGSKLIMKSMVNWKRQGRDRVDFPFQMQNHQLSEHAFTSDESSLKGSTLLKHHLISHFIIFLPLEADHVKKCIKNYLAEIGQEELTSKPAFIQGVFKDIGPFLPDNDRFFASIGCKRVREKVDEALEAMHWGHTTDRSDL